ncbi:MAG: DUF58 domain-containing protein [Nitrospinota bacterium]|nr:MAG: DUF58 domain-containing protein [Nitrospinota bacterium]
MGRVLFDSEFLKKLEVLRLVSKRFYRGRARGEHHTVKRGTSLEFSDYRRYHVGDDFRYIDWNIFSRLDQLFLKLFTAEEDLVVHLLLDTSASMGFGTPPKIDYAKKVAAALGYIALANLDRVGITAFTDHLQDALPLVRGKDQLFTILHHFERMHPQGETAFGKALMEYAFRHKRTGLAIVISDLLDPEGIERGLEALLFSRFDVVVLQIVDEEEIAPPFEGAIRLVDVETGKERRLSVDGRLLQRYQEQLREYFQQIEGFCARRHIEYIRTSTILPFEDLILKYLRQGLHVR